MQLRWSIYMLLCNWRLSRFPCSICSMLCSPLAVSEPSVGGVEMSGRTSHSRLHHSDVGRGRGILKTTGSSQLTHQVDDLRDTLYETSRTMAENESMLAEFQDITHSQSRDLDSLRDELDRSKEMLRTEADRSHRRTSVHFEDDWRRRRVDEELERERRARDRAELGTSHLLDVSLKTTTPSRGQRPREDSGSMEGFSHHNESTASLDRRIRGIEERVDPQQLRRREDSIDNLSVEIKHIKEELMKRRTSERQKELQRELTEMESELSVERRLLGVSQSESQRLADMVDRLGSEVDQLNCEKQKTLSQLEVTTRRLDESIGGREELLKQLEDLHSHLSQSEEHRALTEERYSALLQQCREQEATHQKLNAQIRDIEDRLYTHRRERGAMEDRYTEMKRCLSEKTIEEQRLHERCDQLEARLSEKARWDGEDLQERVISVERECSESRLETSQLRAEMKSVTTERNSLQEQVKHLELDLQRREGVHERLNQQLRDLSSQLSSSEEKRSKVIGQLDEAMRRLECIEGEKHILQGKVLDLESKLKAAERRSDNTHSQALQTLKKYKLRCRNLEQEKVLLEEEKDESMVQCEELQQQLQHLHSQAGTDAATVAILKQENSELKSTIHRLEVQTEQRNHQCQQLQLQLSELEANLRGARRSTEKYRSNVRQLQSDHESIVAERNSLKQELVRSEEQERMAEERLSHQLQHVGQLSKSEALRLQVSFHQLSSRRKPGNNKHRELKFSREDSTKLLTKLTKVSKAYQAAKSELIVLRSQEPQWREENHRLARDLQQVQETLYQREQELSEQIETLRLSHSHEVEHLQQKHHSDLAKLEQKISQLQLQLTDQTSTVHAVRRQQFKAISDHQRMGDDLSKSVEDNEKLRRKYLRAKRFYEEKAAYLESEVADSQGEESESLRRQLATSQSNLLQQSEDHEVILRAVAGEVDSLVKKIGKRVHVPVFPTMIGQETDARKWITDILAKLQWLHKETDDVLGSEETLRRRLQEHLGGSKNSLQTLQD